MARSKAKASKSEPARASLDLHGKTVEEAERILDQFIHRLSEFSSGRARVVVGKGTGAIRKCAMDYLKRARFQFEFERLPNGAQNEGVLIVFLD